ncbi:MAG TPA: sigma-70 family RNA polymerase sigma factor [Solirubrobacteraceae bacterium]|nr:sigma-70 family RNA polymerase sigma factor [Solirubrobacteraceae bacterium]
MNAADRETAAPLLERASRGDEAAFAELVDPYRRELQVHCYRIVGSVQDAEDLVQETLLAAWRGLGRFAGRASLRSWLYRIATNRCLNALRDRRHRLPQLPEPPPEAPQPPESSRLREPVWLEPYPDALLEDIVDQTPDPGARYETREAIGLAFVAGLQRLPPRQRAVLVLRDALGFRAREVAEMLGTSETSVMSVLHRARTALEAELPAPRERAPLPSSPAERELVAQFTDAFEGGDIERVVSLLTDDARLTMPPEPLEYHGPAAIARFLSTVPAGGHLEMFRLVPTRANGQPAFGCYVRDPQAPIAHAYGLMVLSRSGNRVAAITGFPDTSLFPYFGLPRTLPE